jgi:hypothetical protein
MVRWGNDVVPVSSLQPDLKRGAALFRSHGFTPRLLMECYRDTRESDVETLRTIGRDAGFEIVDTAYLGWPSPDLSEASH